MISDKTDHAASAAMYYFSLSTTLGYV